MINDMAEEWDSHVAFHYLGSCSLLQLSSIFQKLFTKIYIEHKIVS